MKKILTLVCMITSIFAFSITSFAEIYVNEDELKSNAESMVSNWDSMDYTWLDDEEKVESYKVSTGEKADQYIAMYNNWRDVREQLGDLVKVETDKTEIIYNDDSVMAKVTVQYTDNKEVILSSTYEYVDGAVSNTDLSAEIVKSLNEKMMDALLNTILGMGVVFLVLIFISFIISLLKFIPKMFEKKAKKEEVVVTTSAEAVQEEVISEDVTDDTELVAVITAAIMASMGDEAPADGLKIRSIRKVNKSKWVNA